MKKNLVSLLLVGALMAPGAIQVAQATGTGTGASHALISEVENDDGTITKTSVTNYGTTIVQVYEFNEETEDWIVVSQIETENETPPTSWDDERLDNHRLVTTKVIPFETIEEPTAELAEGAREVKVTGVEGVISNIIETGYWNGGEIAYDLPGGPIREYSERTSEPINEVVLVGTGIMGEDVDTTRIDIPFETKVVENDELPVGTEEVSQEGIDGWYELTTIYETKDGKRTEVIIGEKGAETDRKDPVNKIIQKGTKEVADEFVVTATLVDEDGNALAGEVLTITGEDVATPLTTNDNGVVTFSVPNGTYTVSFGDVSESVTIEDEDVSVKLVGAVKDDATKLEAKREFVLEQLKELSFSEEELNDFVERVKVAESSEEIDNIFEEAKAKSEENQAAELKTKQDEALDELVELDLTDEERANFKKQVEEAVTVEEVESILQVARKVSTVNKTTTLAEAKTAGLDLLNSLNLSTQELESFISGINEAETVDAVKEVLETATIVSEFNNNVTDGLVEKFPELKDKDYTYETVREENKVTITVKDTKGKVVAVYVYDVTTEEYTEIDVTPGNGGDDETTVEDDESGVVVDKEESEVVAGQPIQVKRTESVDSRANLPETGELGGGLTIMAALLAGLGGLGLLFKRRS